MSHPSIKRALVWTPGNAHFSIPILLEPCHCLTTAATSIPSWLHKAGSDHRVALGRSSPSKKKYATGNRHDKWSQVKRWGICKISSGSEIHDLNHFLSTLEGFIYNDINSFLDSSCSLGRWCPQLKKKKISIFLYIHTQQDFVRHNILQFYLQDTSFITFPTVKYCWICFVLLFFFFPSNETASPPTPPKFTP